MVDFYGFHVGNIPWIRHGIVEMVNCRLPFGCWFTSFKFPYRDYVFFTMDVDFLSSLPFSSKDVVKKCLFSSSLQVVII